MLSGVRLELTGDRLLLTGTDLELTISVEAQVDGAGRRGRRAPRRASLSDVVRSLEPGAVTVTVEGDEAHITRGALPVLDAAAARRRVPAAPGAGRARR